MKIKLTLAALALIAASCSNQEFTEAVQDSQDNSARIVTLQASMPQFANSAVTRASYESDGGTPSGIVMKWTADDKLQLCFKHGGNCYRTDAPIDASSISADGKTATFTLAVPTEIPAADAFDFYAVYQKTNGNDGDDGLFEAGTTNYLFERYEEQNITLDQTGNNERGIIDPVMLFSRTGVTAAQLSTLTLDLAHTGWVMALHLTNNSGAEMDLPNSVSLQYHRPSATSFIWNGYTGFSTIEMDVTSGTITSSSPDWGDKACVRFIVNDHDWLPLYGQKLGAGATIVLYRWAVSTDQVDRMQAIMYRKDAGSGDVSSNFLPQKTVTKGKVYHVFLNWDGTDLKLTDRAGTPLP